LYGTPATEETLNILKDQNDLLRRIIQVVNPLATQDSLQRQRISLDAAPATVTVTGTVTSNIGSGTLAGVTALGGVDARYQFTDAARLTYAQGIRRNLQFS
jgi:hypothetical protein